MPVLLLLFIIMPIVEIAVLIQIGSLIGVLPTIAIVVATAILGTAMLRQQGLATLARARQRMDQGEMPAQQLVEGLLLVVGGVLLLTPGFVTDAAGFLCLIPATRGLIASRMSREALMRFRVSPGATGAGGPFRPGSRGHSVGPRTVGEGASEAASAQGSADAPVRSSGPKRAGTDARPGGGGTPAGRGVGGESAAPEPGETLEGDFRRVD